MPPRKKSPKEDPDAALLRAYELLNAIDAEDGVEHEADQDLVLAAYFGKLDDAKRALDAGASPDARQHGTGQPALWHAVAKDDVAMAKLLLDAGADPLIDVSGYTPLTRAEDEGKVELAALLAKKAGRKQRSPHESLHDAANAGDLEATRRLLEAGADPNKRLYDQSVLERVWHLPEDERAAFLELFLAHGLDANAKLWGEPLLFEVLRLGHAGMLKMLLAAGADANKRGSYKQATFEQLYPVDSPEKRKLVGLLLDHGLDVTDLKCSGEPLTMHLVHAGEVELLQRCFELGADPDLKWNGFTLRQEAEWVADAKKKARFAKLFAAHPKKAKPGAKKR